MIIKNPVILLTVCARQNFEIHRAAGLPLSLWCGAALHLPSAPPFTPVVQSPGHSPAGHQPPEGALLSRAVSTLNHCFHHSPLLQTYKTSPSEGSSQGSGKQPVVVTEGPVTVPQLDTF